MITRQREWSMVSKAKGALSYGLDSRKNVAQWIGRPGGSAGNLETFDLLTVGSGVRISVQSHNVGVYLSPCSSLKSGHVVGTQHSTSRSTREMDYF